MTECERIGMNGSRVTLKDVANECGYTANTVSRAMRDDPHLPPATRQLIRKAAERLGYIPNKMASSLRSAIISASARRWFAFSLSDGSVVRSSTA